MRLPAPTTKFDQSDDPSDAADGGRSPRTWLQSSAQREATSPTSAPEHARDEARKVKERIVAEAERIAAEETHWKNGGERLRQLVEEWKVAERVDRPTETALWKRLSTARNAFAKRRKADFATLDEQREQARIEKERLVSEAEAIAGSTDWGQTAAAYRDLMRQWKNAGRAGRDVEEELWARFKAAQDTFFGARSAAFAERDAEFDQHAEAKERLLAEAERLLPVTDVLQARHALRSIQERWEAIGMVPRESRERMEGQLRKIEETVHQAEESEWRRTNPEARVRTDVWARTEATVAQLRTSIEQLEERLTKTPEVGLDKDAQKAEEALAPILRALQSTKDAVIRVGSVLIVKVDWAVTVRQLTTAEQAALDRHPQLTSSPNEIIAALNLIRE